MRAVLIKPGPTDTPMAAYYKEQGMRVASVEDVAAGIVRAIDKGRRIVYLPVR
jgi:short-subunit dehydrogenase